MFNSKTDSSNFWVIEKQGQAGFGMHAILRLTQIRKVIVCNCYFLFFSVIKMNFQYFLQAEFVCFLWNTNMLTVWLFPIVFKTVQNFLFKQLFLVSFPALLQWDYCSSSNSTSEYEFHIAPFADELKIVILLFVFISRSASITNLSLDRSGSPMVPSYETSVSPQANRTYVRTETTEDERKILLVPVQHLTCC